MAIDIIIKQKLFGTKTMPLEVILGDDLSYGYWEDDQLTEGKLGDTEFIAYDPHAIARGFSVIWNPREKKSVTLRLPMPTSTRELRSFYNCIDRMVRHWGGALYADGRKINLDAFRAGFADMAAFNDKVIGQITQQILTKESENLTIYSAKWALTLGREEALKIQGNPAYFGSWLHEKQSMDVFFCNPRFFSGNEGIIGQFMLMNNLPTVFPHQPIVPFGITDPSTGKPLECSDWRIILVIEGQKEILCEMDYEKFLSLIPEDQKVRYDGAHFLLTEMSEAEVRRLSEQ